MLVELAEKVVSKEWIVTSGALVVLVVTALVVKLGLDLIRRLASVLGVAPVPAPPPAPANAKWLPPLEGEGRPVPCVNPATGKVLGEERAFTAAQIDEAVRRAKIAQEAWRNVPFSERKAVLQDLLQYILDHQDEICRLSMEDTGKVALEAVYGEILTTCEKLRWTMHYGQDALEPEWRTPPLFLMTKTARVEYVPRGVIGIIVPWNYPAHNVFSAVISSLFSGNASVVKVSEWASWSRRPFQTILRSILSARNHNPDLVQIVTGYGDTGEALCKSKVDHVFFIGSPQTGKYVMRSASESLTPVTLELGGKDPFIVFNSASLPQAVDRAMRGAFINCGQNCISAERFYVQEGIYDRFVKEVVAQAKALRQGPSEEGIYDCGAMTMPRQIEIVEELVADALAKGATLATGGKRKPGPGQYYEPTILLNVTHEMKIANEEAFGPVMTIIKFKTEEEVLKMANSTEYALGSSIFTSDYAQAERVTKKLLAGMCTVNDYGMSYLIQSMPFGGAKLSGFGKFNGPEGLRSFCLQKTVVSDRFNYQTPAPAITRYPVLPHAPKVVQEACKLLYGRGLSYKIAALGRLLGLLARGK